MTEGEVVQSPPVAYCLALLTHGDAPELGRCLKSFSSGLSPAPTELRCVIDGPGVIPPPGSLRPWLVQRSPEQEGFCKATERLWHFAAQSPCPFVLYLENDFELLDRVYLQAKADFLEAEPMVAQVQLLRESVNAEEAAAGGVIQKHEQRGEYVVWKHSHIEHWSYFTTNPSLMRTQFMVENPWPDHEAECEGRFGLDLAQRGYRFVIWGDGTPVVKHIGRRRGFGY